MLDKLKNNPKLLLGFSAGLAVLTILTATLVSRSTNTSYVPTGSKAATGWGPCAISFIAQVAPTLTPIPTVTPAISPTPTPTGPAWHAPDGSICTTDNSTDSYDLYYSLTNCQGSTYYHPYSPTGTHCSTSGTDTCYYWLPEENHTVQSRRVNPTAVCEAYGPTGLQTTNSTLQQCVWGTFVPTLTPTPTMTPTLTITPTPTGSPALVNLSVHLQGVTNPASNQTSKTFFVMFKQNNSVISQGNYTFNYLGSDVYKLTSPISLGSNSGLFDIYIKGPSHLQRKWSNIPLYSGTNAPPLDPPTPFIAGDFNNDNILNVQDVSLFLSAWTQPSVTVTPANEIYDANFDGLINIADISLILSNWTAPTVSGDN